MPFFFSNPAKRHQGVLVGVHIYVQVPQNLHEFLMLKAPHVQSLWGDFLLEIRHFKVPFSFHLYGQ